MTHNALIMIIEILVESIINSIKNFIFINTYIYICVLINIYYYLY